MDAPAADTTPPEEKSSSSTSSSGMTPPRMHWRSDSDTTNSVRTLDPLFSARMLWPLPSGRNRMEEPVLTEFSRKASESELRKTASFDFRPVHPLPRRQKTDLDLRRLELKKELEERRRTALRSSRPPLLKSTSEPCAPLTLQQVSSSSSSASPHLRILFRKLIKHEKKNKIYISSQAESAVLINHFHVVNRSDSQSTWYSIQFASMRLSC